MVTDRDAVDADAPTLEIAGPREERMVEAARLLVARNGNSLRVEAGSDPDDPGNALYESGALLPGPKAILAGPTFEEWLEAAYGLPTLPSGGLGGVDLRHERVQAPPRLARDREVEAAHAA